MKIHALAAAAALATASAKPFHSAKHRNKFMKAMDSHAKGRTPSIESLSDEMVGTSKRARTLRKKVMSKAKLVKPTDEPRKLNNNNNGNNNNGNYQQYANYQGNQNGDGYAGSYAQGNNAQQTYADGVDDYFNNMGEWENEFGFDILQYSLSYHRCAAVKQYDDEVAAREDTTSVFATKHFAVFRFCPSKVCEGVAEEEVDEEYKQWAAQNGQQAYNGGDPTQYYDNGQGYESDEDMYEKMKVGGANGEGCQSNYGEYMIELKDYLDVMTEYHEERFEAYCGTCEECMYDVYQQWMASGGGRKLKSKSDATWKDDLESEDFKHAQRELGYNPYGKCPEYDTCRYYKDSCKNGIDDSLIQYSECTQVEGNNGRVAYIGPHCMEDGLSVTLGVYNDDTCSDYIGNGVNIANFLGYELEGDELAPFVAGNLEDVIPAEGIQAQKERYSQLYNADADMAEYLSPGDNMCIPCMASRQPYEQRGNVYDYADADEYDEEINELCENLYLVSARCDKHYRSYNTKSKMQKYAYAIAQEDLACDFIDSVVMGNYNELGQINVDNMQAYNPEGQPEWMANNMMAQTYGHHLTEVTGLQIFGLIAALAACLVLGVWSLSLQRAADKTWKPRTVSETLGEVKEGMTRTASRIMGRTPSELKPSELSERNQSYYIS